MDNDLLFPEDFLWGCSSSAYQIEGGIKNNDWWLFGLKPGKIKNNDSTEIGCDHWNRYIEDFEFLTKMNLNSYRFSIEWSRVFPKPGVRDKKVINHYHKVIDYLIERKIEPYLTLHHFTIPIWWMKNGGLKNQKENHLAHFKEYCQTLAEEFRDKVKFWYTINEPNILAYAGYLSGEFPPQEKSLRSTIKVANTLLKMHTIAYNTIKQIIPKAKIGVLLNIQIIKPYRNKSFIDNILAKIGRRLFNDSTIKAVRTGRLFFRPFSKYVGMKNSFDFIGLNYYGFSLISLKLPNLVTNKTAFADPKVCCVGLGWEPYPEGILYILRKLKKECPGKPIYISENGIATENEQWRSKLLVDHLRMTHQAIKEGIDVKGYSYWSLIDNFEWLEGFTPRFGLIHIDYKTLKRKMKETTKIFGEIAKKNAIPKALFENSPEIYKPEFAKAKSKLK